MKWTICVVLTAVLLVGCNSVVHHGGHGPTGGNDVRIFVPPFANATEDEHSSRALTELTTSALMERGVNLVQTEAALVKSRSENAAGTEGLYLEAARQVKATHLLIGTVHEYRYKTDLDGDPVAGLTLRLVDIGNGATLWQGSSANVGIVFSSLTKTSQRAIQDLVKKIPLNATPAKNKMPGSQVK